MTGDTKRLLVGIGAVSLFAFPPVFLLAVAAFDLSIPSSLVLGVLAVPLAGLTLGLGYLARKVGSEADEPELVSDALAERVGMTSEEYRELTEE